MKNEPDGGLKRSGDIASSTEDVPDEVCMAGVQRGDDDAFALLVRRYEAPLFNYLLRMTGRHSDAEDAFQETFLRVYRRARQYDPRRPFKPWLYRIATNICKDEWRKRKRRGDKDAALAAIDPKTDELTSVLPRPDQSAARRESAEALSAAVAKLPMKQRAVFLMARYDGMAYEEIASGLRIPVGTVKSRMHKAVQNIMATLDNLKP